MANPRPRLTLDRPAAASSSLAAAAGGDDYDEGGRARRPHHGHKAGGWQQQREGLAAVVAGGHEEARRQGRCGGLELCLGINGDRALAHAAPRARESTEGVERVRERLRRSTGASKSKWATIWARWEPKWAGYGLIWTLSPKAKLKPT